MKRAVTLALAVALVAPAGLAAQDSPLPGTVVLSFTSAISTRWGTSVS